MTNNDYDALDNATDEEIRDYIESNEADSYLSSCEFHDLKYI